MLVAVALALAVTRDDGRIVWSVQSRDTAHVASACALRGDSVRLSPALSRLIALAAVAGRTLPPALTGYRVRVESEIALVIRTAAPRDGAGSGGALARERVVQVEQVESALAWSRTGSTDQHVIGYRARAVTANVSALSYFRRPWVVPVLYGNRLRLLLGRGAVHSSADSLAQPSQSDVREESDNNSGMLAVHPFADDRATYYRFCGGDTIAVLHLTNRNIPIVRIVVEPREGLAGRALMFRGTVDLDAARNQIIRMRGQFVAEGRRAPLWRRLVTAGWETVAFAELENGEFDGHYWLPTMQRIEGQGRSPLAGEFRPIVRVVSRFRDYAINPDSGDAGTRGDSLTDRTALAPATLTFAPRDSMTAFRDWDTEIGRATGSAQASDFDDVAPDSWRPQGQPRIDWRAERVNDVLRYNRVEGAFTGAAAIFRFRDAAPGLTLGASGGWAWNERTFRGAAWSRLLRGPWQFGARAERALANTNDFRPQLDYEQSLLAYLVTADDYDYVDRRSVTVSAARAVPLSGAPIVRFEIGPASDRGERTRARYGLFHQDSTFRPNRAVTAGSYLRSAIGIDVHPNVSGEFLEPGIGASFWYERGDGALAWQRVEARLTARRTQRAITYAGRVDAIALFSNSPVPQQLIEFGENEGLPGYAFKEFGGDRAVLGRAAIAYELPLLRAPIRVRLGGGRFRRVFLPGISPSLAIGAQAGWARATTNASRSALALFGTRTDTLTGLQVPATRPTDGIRSTVNFSLRLFGGTIGLGVARPLDRHDPRAGWQFVFGAGQAF